MHGFALCSRVQQSARLSLGTDLDCSDKVNMPTATAKLARDVQHDTTTQRPENGKMLKIS